MWGQDWPSAYTVRVQEAMHLKDLLPLLQNLVWPVFIGLVLFFWRKQLAELVGAFTQGLATGRVKIVKFGPVELALVPPEDVGSIGEPTETLKR